MKISNISARIFSDVRSSKLRRTVDAGGALAEPLPDVRDGETLRNLAVLRARSRDWIIQYGHFQILDYPDIIPYKLGISSNIIQYWDMTACCVGTIRLEMAQIRWRTWQNWRWTFEWPFTTSVWRERTRPWGTLWILLVPFMDISSSFSWAIAICSFCLLCQDP